ncbi:DUF397 domain-containing protein [Streptomyces sp. H27-D2]|uniref:DUF397 domain-containing protein n=1 Tax=Streptomyces sp. H27-D2 TaxID=3046304 RepID=UPI002DBBC830|nr:DUF397 domain-containing protein [Streptomyces sp. H27-D2]MEC4015156.1 DUF397 domain-containing protein [Streptomyces sp. H27-D2]
MKRHDMTSPKGMGSWRKSSYSGANGDCVEIAGLPNGGRAVRDSKNPDDGFFSFPAGEWQAFIQAVKGGELDH